MFGPMWRRQPLTVARREPTGQTAYYWKQVVHFGLFGEAVI